MTFSADRFARSFIAASGTLVFAGLCLAGAAAPAVAGTVYGVNADGHRTAQVSHSDLDLGTQAGRAALETRLRIAARQVCQADPVDTWGGVEASKCVQAAMKAGRNAAYAAVESGHSGR